MLLEDKLDLTRKERERERHRIEMLNAAERVFTRKGYHSATVEEIARESEFAVGTLYNFFKGKDDLYEKVVIKNMEELSSRIEDQVLSRMDPEQAVAAMINLSLIHFEEHKGFARVFFETTPGTRFDPVQALPDICHELYENHVKNMTSIFEKGIQQGCFKKIDPLYLTLLLDSTINAFISYWSRRNYDETMDKRIEKVQKAFLELIRPAETT